MAVARMCPTMARLGDNTQPRSPFIFVASFLSFFLLKKKKKKKKKKRKIKKEDEEERKIRWGIIVFFIFLCYLFDGKY
jgi:hypothetical protein